MYKYDDGEGGVAAESCGNNSTAHDDDDKSHRVIAIWPVRLKINMKSGVTWITLNRVLYTVEFEDDSNSDKVTKANLKSATTLLD